MSRRPDAASHRQSDRGALGGYRSGHPLVGETVYIRDFLAAGGFAIPSPRLLLHAATLGFALPPGGGQVHFESPLPDDFGEVVARLAPAG